jgi:hypothetical protein
VRIAIRLAAAEVAVLALAALAPGWAARLPLPSARPVPVAATAAPTGDAGRPGGSTPVPGRHPSARHAAAMAYDPAHSAVMLFGGDAGGGPLGDTWAWDGSRWAQLSPAHSPSARTGAALAFDGQQGTLVLFGGNEAGGRPAADTWTWSGSDWVPTGGHSAPPGRSGAGLVYDASVGRLVLFGGVGAGSRPLEDTWTWGRQEWSPVSGSTSPGPGMPGSAMAYDARAGRVVLAGVSTTWGLLLGTWSNLGAALPAGCAPAGSAFDSLLAAPVAVCGSDPLALAVWDGRAWQPRADPGAAPGRSEAQVAFDDRTGELVVFGGVSGGRYLDDTWTWTPGRGWSQG